MKTASRENGAPSGMVVRGVPASSGVVFGDAYVYGDILDEVEPRAIDRSEVDAEIERFRSAVGLVKSELARDAQHISEELGQAEADVFLVHSMILEDRSVLEAIERRIRDDLLNAEAVVASEMKRMSKVLASSSDTYLRDRSYDITDIGKRVLERMLGVWAHCPLGHPMIVVARELRASDTVTMDRGRILAFVTEYGGKETHAAILARSLGVPAIVGARGILDKVETGDRVVVDGGAGIAFVNPPREILERYERKLEEAARETHDLGSLIREPSVTKDGARVVLSANIGSVDDAREAAALGADGIGLFRTELLFMAARSFLEEEQQYRTYREVVEMMEERPVTIRVLDIGGDKFVGAENPYEEHNPYLGYRSIRLLLDRPDIFVPQIRAILRAGLHGNVRILLPMVSSVEEVRAARETMKEAASALSAEGVEFRHDVPLGVMIEIPSAAMIAERLAVECDFLSIGTNDLVQYALAVDRGNILVDHLYQPHHPAVLALIAATIAGARSAGRPVALCGEMGGMPHYVPLLLGLGLRDLSVAGGRVLITKRSIRMTDLTEARGLAERAMAAATAGEVAEMIGMAPAGEVEAREYRPGPTEDSRR